MKNYLKPELTRNELVTKERLSSLAGWLEDGGAGADYKDAGITTYVIES